MAKTLLTVGIPTFNRAVRLKKTITKLFEDINSAGIHGEISIFVSNNHSEDNTSSVLQELKKVADSIDINFNYVNQETNIGPARNFIECAFLASSEYIVYLSDDDNLYPNSLSHVLNCIKEYKPNVMVFNFDQKPWGVDNPLYPKIEHFKNKTDFVNLNKLVKWYKLSGVTLNLEGKTEIEFLRVNNFYSNYFGHVLLAIMIARNKGNLVLSPFFFAHPDDDYMEHVNFAPYVSEMMYRDLELSVDKKLLTHGEFEELSKLLPRQSVLSRSIHRLSEFYSEKYLLTASVKTQLWSNVSDCILSRKKLSREGLPLRLEIKDTLRLVRLFLFWIKFKIKVIFKLTSYRVEKEGF